MILYSAAITFGCRSPANPASTTEITPQRGPSVGVRIQVGAVAPNCSINWAFRWLPFLDTYRTLCAVPPPDFQRLLEDIRRMRFAA